MTHAGKALIDPEAIFAKINLGKGMRVADLGCGRTGHFIFTASRIVGDSGLVYAVDIMKDIVQGIKNRARAEGFDNIQVIWSDVEVVGQTPIPPGSLDVCFLINLLFLTKDRKVVLTEAMRLLKSGGLLTVVDWKKKLGPLGPEPAQQVDPNDLTADAAELNLTPQDRFAAGEYHYCLIFKKT